MADSVKFTINVEEKISDRELKKIKEEIKKELRHEEKKTTGKKHTPTSRSPIKSPRQQQQEGGIFGRIDPGVKGFEKRQAISGGIKSFRDNRSKQAIVRETFPETLANLKKDIRGNTISTAAIENTITNHMDSLVKGSDILANPKNFVDSRVIGLLTRAGPHGAAIVAAITAIAVAPEVIKEIIQELSQKGLPLNRDFKRLIEEESGSLFDVEEKKKRLFGIDSYIITQTDRYQPESGSETHNSFENRDEIIISKIGQAEKAVGVI